MLGGLLGFVVVLIADALVVGLTLHEPAIDAIHLATRTIVTVGPTPTSMTVPNG